MTTDEKVDEIYKAYPKRVAKGKARAAIAKALKKVAFEELVEAVKEYAEACVATGIQRDFIPYPATWFNQERWDDDREEWWRSADGSNHRETAAEARERGNLNAISGFLRRAELRKSDAGIDGPEANGRLY